VTPVDAARQLAQLKARADALAAPLSDRLSREFARLEREARAIIDDAKRRSQPSSEAIEAAKEQERQTRRAHAVLWNRIHELDAKIAAARTPERRFWNLLGSRRDEASIQHLLAERKSVVEHAVASERRLLRAVAAVSWTEQRTQEQAAAERKQSDAQIAVASETLRDVARARLVVEFWPAVAFCAPTFVLSVGRRIESVPERRSLRNTQATDIWGLPLQP
jgi:hypothetical protein